MRRGYIQGGKFVQLRIESPVGKSSLLSCEDIYGNRITLEKSQIIDLPDEDASNLDDQSLKDDEGKPRYDLLPPMALEAVACVCAYGAIKYPDKDEPWRSTIGNGRMRLGRLFRASMSHLWAWWRGEENDRESGLPHLAHAAWNVMWMLEFMLASWLCSKRLDDRRSLGRKVGA